MREISVNVIKDIIKDSCLSLSCVYPEDVYKSLVKGYEEEVDTNAKIAMNMLIDNAKIAKEESIPICQDTGMVSVFLSVGQEVHLVDGDVNEAINEGVRQGYEKYYLRKSIVNDPLFERKNTKDNTPVIIHTKIIPGDNIILDISTKGFGSENMSSIKMCKPSDGIEGVKQFIIDTIKTAGPNACPPMVVGVGIGGSFDYAPILSKKALLRPLDESNSDDRYKALEDELLIETNNLNIGPLGLKGKTTALKIQIEHAPTHIAGLPVAISICCHASRHLRKVI